MTYHKLRTFLSLPVGFAKKVSIDFSLVQWGNSTGPVFDLRKWSSENGPQKGISFSEKSLKQLYSILQIALDDDPLIFDKNLIKTISVGKLSLKVIKEFGIFAKVSKTNEEKKVTLSNWGNGNKYDIRTWFLKDGQLQPGKGVLLSREETEKLFDVIEDILENGIDARVEKTSITSCSSSPIPSKDEVKEQSCIIETILPFC